MSSTTLILFGITGDLAKKKLLPALTELCEQGKLPRQFKIVGVSRRAVDRADFPESLDISLVQMDLANAADYEDLKETVDGDSERGSVLAYLSVPPDSTEMIMTNLGQAGFGEMSDFRLLLEKPFGRDLASAQALAKTMRQHFSSAQIFHVDHYLAKPLTQAIIDYRRQYQALGKEWGQQSIKKIEIIASESIGIAERGVFYEQAGALRDFIQGHLLEVAATTLGDDNHSRLSALQHLTPADPTLAYRGQYEGYREAVQNPASVVETFAAVTLFSQDPAWEGVPIVLVSGKSLDKKESKVVLHLAGDETVEITGDEAGREAYQTVFLEALAGLHGVFPATDEILTAWKIVAPVQAAWYDNESSLVTYPVGVSIEKVLSS